MPLEILSSQALVPYEEAIAFMEKRVALIEKEEAKECLWFLEHPPLYTAGTSAKPEDLLTPSLPIFNSGRGGQYTYHGPGQRVIYVMLDLAQRGQDIHQLVEALEQWIILTLKALAIDAFTRKGRVGVWTLDPGIDPGIDPGVECKIAAIGIRVRRWISFHGLALNVSPDLDAFKDIVPCGLKGFGVTSCRNLGNSISLQEMDDILLSKIKEIPFFNL